MSMEPDDFEVSAARYHGAAERQREAENGCYECGAQLVGPLCPECNIVISDEHQKYELRMAGFYGLIVGALLTVIATHLF